MGRRVKMFGYYITVDRHGRNLVCAGKSCEVISGNPTKTEIAAAFSTAQANEEARLGKCLSCRAK